MPQGAHRVKTQSCPFTPASQARAFSGVPFSCVSPGPYVSLTAKTVLHAESLVNPSPRRARDQGRHTWEPLGRRNIEGVQRSLGPSHHSLSLTYVHRELSPAPHDACIWPVQLMLFPRPFFAHWARMPVQRRNPPRQWNHEIRLLIVVFKSHDRTFTGRGNVSSGSIPAAQLRGRHGRTCFNTGRQVTHPPCRFLIDEMPVSTNGNRGARSTPESRRHGRRPWHLQRARTGRHTPSLARQIGVTLNHKLSAGRAELPYSATALVPSAGTYSRD